MAFGRIQEQLSFCFIQRLQFLLLNAWQNAGVCGIEPDVTIGNCLL